MRGGRERDERERLPVKNLGLSEVKGSGEGVR